MTQLDRLMASFGSRWSRYPLKSLKIFEREKRTPISFVRACSWIISFLFGLQSTSRRATAQTRWNVHIQAIGRSAMAIGEVFPNCSCWISDASPFWEVRNFLCACSTALFFWAQSSPQVCHIRVGQGPAWCAIPSIWSFTALDWGRWRTGSYASQARQRPWSPSTMWFSCLQILGVGWSTMCIICPGMSWHPGAMYIYIYIYV